MLLTFFKRMLKIITIFLNVLIILFSIYEVVIGEVMSISRPIDVLVFSLFYILPTLNLLTLLKATDRNHWIYLFFRAKALKEKRKILEMEKHRIKEEDFDDYC